VRAFQLFVGLRCLSALSQSVLFVLVAEKGVRDALRSPATSPIRAHTLLLCVGVVQALFSSSQMTLVLTKSRTPAHVSTCCQQLLLVCSPARSSSHCSRQQQRWHHHSLPLTLPAVLDWNQRQRWAAAALFGQKQNQRQFVSCWAGPSQHPLRVPALQWCR
jgi:hypothetical protein